MIPAATSAVSHLLGIAAYAERDVRQARYTPAEIIWHAIKGGAKITGDSMDDIAERTYHLAFGEGAPLRSPTSAQAVDRLVALLIAQWAAERADAHPALADAFDLRLALRRAIASRWPLERHLFATVPGRWRPTYGYRVVDGETVIRHTRTQQSLLPHGNARTLRTTALRHDRALGAAGLRDVLRALCSFITADPAHADRSLVLRHSSTPLRVDRGRALGPALLDAIRSVGTRHYTADIAVHAILRQPLDALDSTWWALDSHSPELPGASAQAAETAS
ncbi:hypothetical protein [Kitasatospora aureofaciens]|uniref:hypothetical protein n=1 Tax=Kitasatospora aureofaciens TaxID=1894 RepID=UPI0005272D9A|nr:hypothetical protein [Kitasatospora aureofaciens]